MYYKHDHDHIVKSQELGAIIVEQILGVCVNKARFNELKDATQRVASFSRYILKKYLFYLIEYGIISYQGQNQVYVITWEGLNLLSIINIEKRIRHSDIEDIVICLE
jgi:predicted transcriptional regulator